MSIKEIGSCMLEKISLSGNEGYQKKTALSHVLVILQGQRKLQVQRAEEKREEFTLKGREIVYIPENYCYEILPQEEKNFCFLKIEQLADKCLGREQDKQNRVVIRSFDSRKPFQEEDGVELIDDLHPEYAKGEEGFSQDTGPAIDYCVGRMKIPSGTKISRRWNADVEIQVLKGRAGVFMLPEGTDDQRKEFLSAESSSLTIPARTHWCINPEGRGDLEVMTIVSPYWKDEYNLDLLF